MTAMTIIFIVVIGALIFCYSTIISDWKFLANHYKADRDRWRREAEDWESCSYCGSDDIVEIGSSKDGNGKVIYSMQCNVCGETWEETDDI